jgi:hypothetical protein
LRANQRQLTLHVCVEPPAKIARRRLRDADAQRHDRQPKDRCALPLPLRCGASQATWAWRSSGSPHVHARVDSSETAGARMRHRPSTSATKDSGRCHRTFVRPTLPTLRSFRT